MSDKKAKHFFQGVFTTPPGVLNYPFLTGKGRDFNNDGNFQLSTKYTPVPGAEADAFFARLKAIEADALKNAQGWNKTSKRMEPMFDPDEDTAFTSKTVKKDKKSGAPTVTFKASPTVKTATGVLVENRIRAFDATMQPIPDFAALNIRSGTKAAISFTAKPWKLPTGSTGMKLVIHAIQILEAVTFVPGQQAVEFESAEEYGFEASEGFTYSDSDAAGAAAGDDREDAGAGEL